MFSIPFIMLSGFFSNAKNFVPYLIPFKYICIFKWAYQLVVYNEFDEHTILTCNNPPNECFALGDIKFDESFKTSFAVISANAVFYGLIAFFLIYRFNKFNF